MPESKQRRWVDDDAVDRTSEVQDADAQTAANDADGWQQYRRWIRKAPVNRCKRVGIDPALYTWKGYRSWTEEVRRNWSDDADTEGG